MGYFGNLLNKIWFRFTFIGIVNAVAVTTIAVYLFRSPPSPTVTPPAPPPHFHFPTEVTLPHIPTELPPPPHFTPSPPEARFPTPEARFPTPDLSRTITPSPPRRRDDYRTSLPPPPHRTPPPFRQYLAPPPPSLRDDAQTRTLSTDRPLIFSDVAILNVREAIRREVGGVNEQLATLHGNIVEQTSQTELRNLIEEINGEERERHAALMAAVTAVGAEVRVVYRDVKQLKVIFESIFESRQGNPPDSDPV